MNAQLDDTKPPFGGWPETAAPSARADQPAQAGFVFLQRAFMRLEEVGET